MKYGLTNEIRTAKEYVDRVISLSPYLKIHKRLIPARNDSLKYDRTHNNSQLLKTVRHLFPRHFLSLSNLSVETL